jgi:hypothetical protein
LAKRWQVTSIHLEGIDSAKPAGPIVARLPLAADLQKPNGPGKLGKPQTSHRPVDLVLGYRNLRKMERLAARSQGRLRIVDSTSAYFRLRPDEAAPAELFAGLKHLLRLPERPL